ncbi:MAG: hypothetical protein U0531_09520 [Dehalococcoidia bacterium]
MRARGNPSDPPARVAVHLRGNDLLLVPESPAALDRLPGALRDALHPDARQRGARLPAARLAAVEAAPARRPPDL